jgi:hypothetical protein
LKKALWLDIAVGGMDAAGLTGRGVEKGCARRRLKKKVPGTPTFYGSKRGDTPGRGGLKGFVWRIISTAEVYNK